MIRIKWFKHYMLKKQMIKNFKTNKLETQQTRVDGRKYVEIPERKIKKKVTDCSLKLWNNITCIWASNEGNTVQTKVIAYLEKNIIWSRPSNTFYGQYFECDIAFRHDQDIYKELENLRDWFLIKITLDPEQWRKWKKNSEMTTLTYGCE